MKPSSPSRGGLVLGIPVAAVLVSPLSAALTWNNSSADNKWSTPPNWDSGFRPSSTDDTIFPAGLGGTLTLEIVPTGVGNYTPTAQSIQFNDNYTVNGTFSRSAGGGVDIGVSSGSLVTWNAGLTLTGDLVKSGPGTLVVNNLLNTPSGATINDGVLRANIAGSLGGTGDTTKVNSGGTLELNGFHHAFPITLNDGSTLKGLGSSSTNFSTNSLVISGAATAVSIGAVGPADVLRTDYMVGGSTSTVITTTGAGTLRLNSAQSFNASWVIPSGTVQIVGTLESLGVHSAGSVTLSGGTLAVELPASSADYTDGPGNHINVTANSGFLNDRGTTPGTGRSATFGTLTMGAQTLSVAAGPNITSGDAGFYFQNLTLTGDPILSVTQGNTGPGHFAAYSLTGGGVPRTITKTGPGNLSFHASGTNELATGSTVNVSGGGNLLLNFPPLGPDAVTAVSMEKNPIGNANLTMTDGTLMLRGSGPATTYALPTHLTLGGTVIVDPERNVSGSATGMFRMADITLKPGTVMGVSGDNGFGIGSLGPMVLEGNATLKGFDSGSTADGVINLYGGISGGPSSTLTIGNALRPINLTIGASSTYGGGTTMNGGNVTLNASNAFGTGPTTLAGGNLTLNSDTALNGTVTINGGNLVAVGGSAFANPVLLNGGTLELRTNVSAPSSIPSLTVTGTATLHTARVSSSGSVVLTMPTIDVLGNTTLTVSNAGSAASLLSGVDLAGDLTLSATSAARITSITEDSTPRKLIKTGSAQLDLEGASSHSGGTEVLAGTLFVENSGALGSGPLTIGATSGTAAATAAFASGLTIPNPIVIRSGSSGAATLDSIAGNVTWSGTVDLQKTLTLDNGSGVSQFTGLLSGLGNLSKISGGEIVLGNASNSFGSGAATSVSISAGILSVATDGALGNAANGVNLTGSGRLTASATFDTSRTITLASGSSTGVTTGNVFTVNSPFGGTGTLTHFGPGTLAIGPSVDNTARGSAVSLADGGTIRVQGLKGLGNASPISADNGGTFEFLRDPDTNFAHAVSILGHSGIRVDRAIGGSGTNGRHTLGALTVTQLSGNSLTVSGANGYGLTATSYTTAANSTITNNAPGTLILGALTGNPNTSNRALTIGGTGDIQVTGATSEGVGTGAYNIVKQGPGRFTLGTSVADFNRLLEIDDGVFDLNGLTYSALGLVTMGGTVSTLGARIETGTAGSLNLGAGLTYSNTNSPPGAVITGNVGIGTVAQPFTINNSTAAADLTINGPITGSAGSSITKSGAGTLVLSGAGNTLPGLFSVSGGVVELGKSSGDAIGTGGLATSVTGIVRLTADEQINNNAAVSIGTANESFLELANFTETTGPLTITQTNASEYSAVKTGATGTLVLSGNLSLNNNSNSSATDGREVLITGTGAESTAATDGTLDLGGVNRTIQVSTTTVGTNEPRANATIETRIINGGIVKTGARTLNLTNPNNTFAGGLQIAQGFVRPGSLTSLGLGPVTFTNGPGIAAGIDYGTLTGTQSTAITTGSGTGDATYLYQAAAPNTLVLSGGAAMTQNLIFDVVNGTTTPGDSAVLDVTGILDDGAGTFGVTKTGNGTLKLANNNTYSGPTTVQKGILSIASNSALGDSTAALTLNGGALQTTSTWSTSRGLAFGTAGGSVRVDAAAALEFTGNVAWESGTSAFFGAGVTILSGSTSGTGGNLQLGAPMAFATVPFTTNYPLGHRLSLRGTAALPAGNLSITHDAVLELGNGDFIRPLGTAAGEVQFPTAIGGGWAAHGANRIVNLGGASAPVIWGQTSPAFLFQSVSGDDYGDLILGSATATHRIDFLNPLQLNNGQFSMSRQIEVPDGPAAVEARISGGIAQGAAPGTTFATLAFEVDGVLEITGPLSGEMDLQKSGSGTVVLSGADSFTGYSDVYEGTLRIANNAAWANPHSFYIETGATLDASAMSSPLNVSANDFASIYGTLLGDVTVAGYLEGNGFIDGSVHAESGAYVLPDYDGQLHVTGDFTLDSGALIEFYLASTTPLVEYNQMCVGGTVTLDGHLLLDGDSLILAEGNSFFLVLNDGTDPIIGTFDRLPEGGVVPIGNGLALQVTYQANGDGGAIGNDIGFTVVTDTTSTDLAMSVDAPLAVDLASSFSVTYTINNLGPNDSSASSLEVELPSNATFNGSTPAGSVVENVLTIPVPALANGSNTTVTLNFTAPGAASSVFVAPWIYNGTGDPDTGNDFAPSVTAVLPGGVPVIDSFITDLENGLFLLGIETLPNVRYAFQQSIDLEEWSDLLEFFGDGELMEFQHSIHEEKEFFRFSILPYDDGGSGSPE